MIDTLPDIPRVVTAVAEWLACLVYILVLPRRFGRIATAALLASGLVFFVGVQLFAGSLPVALWTPGMAIAFGAMSALIATTTRIGARDVGYVAARAFVLAELVASLEWQLHVFYSHPSRGLWGTWQAVALVVVYVVLFGGAHLLERRHFSPNEAPHIGPRTLSLAIAIAVITFALSNLSFVAPNTPFSGQVSPEVFYIRTLVDLCGFIALYAQHEQIRKQRADAELAAMNAILHSQHEQYLQSRRDIERADRTYHDLKHQVSVIRGELDPARRVEFLDSLEASINEFGATFRTGNPVVDTVLTAKARQCQAAGINFTCVADGTLLDHVDAMDLASVLGNALDNAIESVLRLTDPEQRLIRVAVFAQNDFVVSRFENYFDGELRYRGGELATRKTSRGRHGLGLKSIQHVAEKYGGSASITDKDNWFTLTVLLPRGVS